jgi:hypothetical protein
MMLLGTGKSTDLRTQIAALEQDILSRQQLLHTQARGLDEEIRQRLSAPSTLIWVAAAGFLLGELGQPTRAASPAPVAPAAAQARPTTAPRYKRILQCLALIRSSNAALAFWHALSAHKTPAPDPQPTTPTPAPVTPVPGAPQPGSADEATQAPS